MILDVNLDVNYRGKNLVMRTIISEITNNEFDNCRIFGNVF